MIRIALALTVAAIATSACTPLTNEQRAAMMDTAIFMQRGQAMQRNPLDDFSATLQRNEYMYQQQSIQNELQGINSSLRYMSMPRF